MKTVLKWLFWWIPIWDILDKNTIPKKENPHLKKALYEHEKNFRHLSEVYPRSQKEYVKRTEDNLGNYVVDDVVNVSHYSDDYSSNDHSPSSGNGFDGGFGGGGFSGSGSGADWSSSDSGSSDSSSGGD